MKKFKFTPQKLMIVLFTAAVLFLGTAFLINPKKDFSENENRYLQDFPSLINSKKWDSAESFREKLDAIRWDEVYGDDHQFMRDVETYYTDHFWLRDNWIQSKNLVDKLIGKQEIKGVFTVNNKMIQAFKSYDKDVVDKTLAAINSFAEKHASIPMSIMLAPTAQEIYSSELPEFAELASQKSFIDYCYTNLNIVEIDVLSLLTENKDDYIYYRTDHHWTSFGAYLAYTAAAKRLGYTAYDRSSFTIEHASDEFRGTLYSKTLDDSVTPDTINFYTLHKGDPAVTVTVNTGEELKTYDSLYLREYLDVKDKYSSFLGENAPIVTIETKLENNDKSILIFKDSYAHSLVPFLSKHFSKITMVDMRYIKVGIENFVNIEDFSQVLFMYNAITFAEDESLKQIK